MKEIKKNTTTFGCVVVSDEEAVILNRLRDYYNNTTHHSINAFSDYETRCLLRLVARYGEDGVREGINKVECSDFLSGRKGCDWAPDLAWIVTPRNFDRILNGKYDDFKYASSGKSGGTVGAAPASPAFSSFDNDEFLDAALNRGFSDFG